MKKTILTGVIATSLIGGVVYAQTLQLTVTDDRQTKKEQLPVTFEETVVVTEKTTLQLEEVALYDLQVERENLVRQLDRLDAKIADTEARITQIQTELGKLPNR